MADTRVELFVLFAYRPGTGQPEGLRETTVYLTPGTTSADVPRILGMPYGLKADDVTVFVTQAGAGLSRASVDAGREVARHAFSAWQAELSGAVEEISALIDGDPWRADNH